MARSNTAHGVVRSMTKQTRTASGHGDASARDAHPDQPANRLHDAQWRTQVDRHFYLRKQVISRLQRLHPVLSTDSTMRHAGQETRIPELVQRLELMLYKSASSLEEYMNPCTLERRVHALVTLLEPLPPPTFCKPASPVSRKRQHPTVCLPQLSAPTNKRSRRCQTYSTASEPVATACSSPLTSVSSEVLGHIFSFVDGVETLRTCSLVNRSLHAQAPTLVTSLSINVANPAHAALLHHRVASLLSKCCNLQQLVLTNSRNDGKKSGFSRSLDGNGTGSVDPRTAYATAIDPTQFTGRVFLYELGHALHLATTNHRRVLFPRLQSVELVTPFDCANEADSTIHFLRDLAANFAVEPTRRSPLRSLVLDTTVLGDRRMPRLVALMAQYPSVFHHELQRLDLTNNFVGEAGARELCTALTTAPWSALRSLSLRRNILSDHDATQLAGVLPAHSTPALEWVDVSENFIGKPGFQALADSAKSHDVRVQWAMNCMETDEAGRLFM